jgi:hypothetical protein
MSVVPMKGLGPEETDVQERCIGLLRAEPERLIAEYRVQFGVVIGTDLAREMFPEYCATIETRLRFAVAVQRTAAALADMVFEQIVSELSGGIAFFTAGGTGAGKTTSILRHGKTRDIFNSANIIIDGNLNSFKPSEAKIEAVLERGCKVVVVFVHRHPVAAYIKGVISRALEQGRTVPIHGHLRMHKDSIDTFLRCHRKFSGNQDVSFIVLNNTGHEQESFPASVDYLKAVKYDAPVLEAAIRKGLENELAENNISEALYKASCGDPCA